MDLYWYAAVGKIVYYIKNAYYHNVKMSMFATLSRLKYSWNFARTLPGYHFRVIIPKECDPIFRQKLEINKKPKQYIPYSNKKLNVFGQFIEQQ